MKHFWKLLLIGLAFLLFPLQMEARRWTLKDCIDYALRNNISLQKTRVQKMTAEEDVKQSQAALLPSLNFSTNHNVSYNPWPESSRTIVANDQVQTSVDKVYYNGTYGLNANWTVWNGNQNHNQVKLNKLAARQAELESAVSANNIQEQIAQLYVQILYSNEAIKVSKNALETSKTNEERGKAFVEVGKMSKADLAQLTAQRAQDEYNIVQAESNLRNYKRQLKQLLQITDDEEFDVVIPETTDAMALQDIPNMQIVYTSALSSRPEIKNAQLGIESSNVQVKLAKGYRYPTVSLNAGVGTSHNSMADYEWGKQMKNNLNIAGGVSLSIPIFDHRQTKTAISKAMLQRQSYMLDLRDRQTTLYSTIENYWLQAVTNQNMFKAAKTSTESAQTSYDLLSEQFRLGLKNTVELMTGRDNLLQAQQNELQSKYLTILNIDMLNFYQNGELR